MTKKRIYYIHTNIIENGKNVVLDVDGKYVWNIDSFMDTRKDFVEIGGYAIKRDAITYIDKYEEDIPDEEDIEEPFVEAV